VGVLFFALHINDAITISEGEIVATSPQYDYKAPFEGQVIEIKVKEGQPVKAGDTLVVMQNADYLEQQAKAATEIEYLQKRIQSMAVLQEALEKKKDAIDQTHIIHSKKYQLDTNRLANDISILDEQYAFQLERLSSAYEKYVGDSILYKKDMLSKYEYNNSKDAYLALKESLAIMESERNRHLAEKHLAYNTLTGEQNSLQLTQLQLEENTQALLQSKNEYESQLIQAKETLHKIEAQLNKQNVIAAHDGLVNFLFNTRLASNLITKGDLLVSIAPHAITYYAKVIIPEKDMPYVKAGLPARLKLDAYHHLEHGTLNGKVSYIAERKENEKFYALVELPPSNKFQLKSGFTIHGEIVLQRLPLYKYFVKKLFKQFDKA